ncbi:MAG: GvpL/GvpF family gas vesicle protein, partial [Chloroflexi bacterium]|nr:GvpL/GvpF family gas vesicle protein [Chloroflexota bacterium]
MTQTYLYAIIPTGAQLVFAVAGLDNDQDEVYTIPHQDLAAVVSVSPLAEYRGLPRDQAARYLVAHQRVVEAVMREYPLLPLKFGTVLPDKAGVRRLLAQGEALFSATLARLTDLVQMEVVVFWDLSDVFQQIGQEERIVQLKTQIAGRPPEATVAERIALGQQVQAALEQRRTALRDRLLPSLQEPARDLVVNPLMDDSMVANVALLLDPAGRAALDQRLELLDQTFAGRLTLRRVGPLPPYSFATVEVQATSFAAVDAARRQLNLGQAAVPGEIKRAYHQLAGQLHPDHNPGDPAAETRMAALTGACELLLAYATAEVGESSGTVCQFDR